MMLLVEKKPACSARSVSMTGAGGSPGRTPSAGASFDFGSGFIDSGCMPSRLSNAKPPGETTDRGARSVVSPGGFALDNREGIQPESMKPLPKSNDAPADGVRPGLPPAPVIETDLAEQAGFFSTSNIILLATVASLLGYLLY